MCVFVCVCVCVTVWVQESGGRSDQQHDAAAARPANDRLLAGTDALCSDATYTQSSAGKCRRQL